MKRKLLSSLLAAILPLQAAWADDPVLVMGEVRVSAQRAAGPLASSRVLTSADVLGADNVLAVTGKSDSVASWMEDTAREVARDFGIPWLELETREMDDPRYAANPSNRCYFCKSELWGRLTQLAGERGMGAVLVRASGATVVRFRGLTTSIGRS